MARVDVLKRKESKVIVILKDDRCRNMPSNDFTEDARTDVCHGAVSGVINRSRRGNARATPTLAIRHAGARRSSVSLGRAYALHQLVGKLNQQVRRSSPQFLEGPMAPEHADSGQSIGSCGKDINGAIADHDERPVDRFVSKEGAELFSLGDPDVTTADKAEVFSNPEESQDTVGEVGAF
jgi:hypothetical protein